MGINVKVDAFGPGQHRLATKYEVEIGELMAKTASSEGKNFGKHIPAINPTKQRAQRERDNAEPLVFECLLKHGPMTRDDVCRKMKEEGNVFPRDATIHALLEGKRLGFVRFSGETRTQYWFICDRKKMRSHMKKLGEMSGGEVG